MLMNGQKNNQPAINISKLVEYNRKKIYSDSI